MDPTNPIHQILRIQLLLAKTSTHYIHTCGERWRGRALLSLYSLSIRLPIYLFVCLVIYLSTCYRSITSLLDISNILKYLLYSLSILLLILSCKSYLSFVTSYSLSLILFNLITSFSILSLTSLSPSFSSYIFTHSHHSFFSFLYVSITPICFQVNICMNA